VTRRFLALGDSYTIGEGVGTSERWPAQLAASLRADGFGIGEPRVIARTGWTTDELLSALDAISPPLELDFDLVTLLIGVNDQYRGRSTEQYRSGIQLLLARALSCAEGEPARVVIVSIPDWSVTPFALSDPRGTAVIAREIDLFNGVARAAARAEGAAFVDVTTDSRRAARDRALLANDGLHPSAAMYESWVRLLLPAARQILGT
jgi:lysophospholipase L1-like esterase